MSVVLLHGTAGARKARWSGVHCRFADGCAGPSAKHSRGVSSYGGHRGKGGTLRRSMRGIGRQKNGEQTAPFPYKRRRRPCRCTAHLGKELHDVWCLLPRIDGLLVVDAALVEHDVDDGQVVHMAVPLKQLAELCAQRRRRNVQRVQRADLGRRPVEVAVERQGPGPRVGARGRHLCRPRQTRRDRDEALSRGAHCGRSTTGV